LSDTKSYNFYWSEYSITLIVATVKFVVEAGTLNRYS
jgi:hypothetical protein